MKLALTGEVKHAHLQEWALCLGSAKNLNMQVLVGFTCLMCILRSQILPNLEMAVVITASCLKIVCSLMTTLGSFPNPTLSLKDHALKVLCVVSLVFLPLFLFRSFFFFSFFCFLFLLSLLGFSFSLRVCWVSQHHGPVFALLPGLGQKLSVLLNVWRWLSAYGSCWSQLGCYGSFSLPYMLLFEGFWIYMWPSLLFKLFLGFVFCFSVRVGLPHFSFLLIFCWMLNLFNLIFRYLSFLFRLT